MSIEKRVKPPKKRKSDRSSIERVDFVKVTIVLSVLLLISLVSSISLLFSRSSEKDLEVDSLTTDMEAVRTMLSERVTYEGTWYAGKDNLFEIFMPLDENFDVNTSSYKSDFVRISRNAQSNMLEEAFGLLVGSDRYKNSIATNADAVFNSIRDSLFADIARASYAYDPVGSYEYQLKQLSNGTPALYLSGTVDMNCIRENLGYGNGDKAPEDNAETETSSAPEDTNKDPAEEYRADTITVMVKAYILLVRGYPVVVWSCWDALDYFSNERSNFILDEEVSTLWERQYLRDHLGWTPTLLEVDENGFIIFEDTDEESDPTDVGLQGEIDLDTVPINPDGTEHTHDSLFGSLDDSHAAAEQFELTPEEIENMSEEELEYYRERGYIPEGVGEQSTWVDIPVE